MKKKYIIILLILITLCTVFFLINYNVKNENTQSKNNNYDQNIDPISKETALKVLKARYGNKVSNNQEDIKQEGDKYIVDVHVKVEDEEEGSLKTHVHEQSIGEHKINIYTGEIIENQKK